jgi:hypothetical protein
VVWRTVVSLGEALQERGCPQNAPTSQCCLEIEASSDAVDVEAYAGAVELRDAFAFHALEVNFLEAHVPKDCEFVFLDAAFSSACESAFQSGQSVLQV